MYTLVLMTALSGGPDATRFDGWGGGCYGTSCVGSYYACYGGGYGGPLFPRARAFLSGVGEGLRGAFAPPGTYRSWGFGCGSGGYASCSGCYGSCYGSGCFGSCYGFGRAYAGSAVYGGCYGTSCAGCYGGGCIGYSAALPSIPTVTLAAESVAPTHIAMKPAADQTAASLVVTLPAAARLYVDGTLVPGDGPSRRFHTPPLTTGQSYFYELKAEVLVGGKTETEETRVTVRSGDNKDVSFTGLKAAVARASESLAAK